MYIFFKLQEHGQYVHIFSRQRMFQKMHLNMHHSSHILILKLLFPQCFLFTTCLKKKESLMSSLYLNLSTYCLSAVCVCEVTTVSSAPTSRANAALLTSGTILIHLLKTATWDKPTSPALGLYRRTKTASLCAK